ncbi:MAG: divergent polysaccharide deacetylase family protein [Spirochaetes bacterium]|nr:divergent polysaccharide deacetylase family protein [Spirochaetota bacterium]
MTKILYYPMKFGRIIIFTALAAYSFGDRIFAKSNLPEAMQDTAKQIESLWSEGLCETIMVRKKGNPLASIACNGNFGVAQRQKLLDILLKNFFTIKKESYKLRPKNGMYLYQTRYGNQTVYFKLYVRGALDLWPRNPVDGKQIAIYVQNVRASKDLVKWRTLGIPLTFGITFGRSDTHELMQQLSAYGDETWLSIPLEDDNIEIADGNLLNIADALDSERLAAYLGALGDEDQLHGVSPLYCSRFCKNVPALRALFAALRDHNKERELILLDADRHDDSSFYQTGRIMNFRTFRAYMAKNNFCPALSNFLSLKGENAARIMAVDAADETAFRCLHQFAQRQSDSIEFMRISEMSLTNPFR